VTADDDHLARAYAAILAEARRDVAAGGANLEALRERVRAATRLHRARGGDAAQAERRALEQLERIAAVQRARTRVAARPAAPPAPAAPAPLRRPLLRTRATITGNMDVRRAGSGVLAWDAAAAVTEWEVRISERATGARDYAVRETATLPATATTIELPLGDAPLRVHLLGRGRGGRLVRRAIVSGLTRESWEERWERRATAS